jgi:diacylglycerol kinase (ATP)
MFGSAPGPVVAIVNPTAGAGRGGTPAHDRAAQLAAFAAGGSATVEVRVTSGVGNARELAHAAAARGASTVIACGGDGTVNEVASALAFRNVTLAVIPAGSGNGLARDLGIPLDAKAAFDTALSGTDRLIDGGELDGRLFFNVAGIGLDAQVAQRFAHMRESGGGLWRYVRAAVHEARRFEPQPMTLRVAERTWSIRPLILAFANTRQYGNGALIAPRAAPDDGALDLVVVGSRSIWSVVMGVPALFSGRLADQPGVTMEQVTGVEVESPRPLLCHVDGEPHQAGTTVSVRVRPGALRVRVPGRVSL